MLVIPAIHLHEGACVQLVGGSCTTEVYRHGDPVSVARQWEVYGFTRLQVVDLDAALGRGDNRLLVRDILSAGVRTQVGGGVRDEAGIERLLDDGAVAVVVGTRALEDRTWIGEMADAHAASLIVAADVRERRVVTRGWERTLPRRVEDVVDELNDFPLGGVLVTAVHRDGLMRGPDLRLVEDVVGASHHPVLASGGVGAMDDLYALADCGVQATIVGMALYTGAIDPRLVAEEFGT